MSDRESLEALRVKDLKELLKEKGLDSSGRKADLVNRLLDNAGDASTDDAAAAAADGAETSSSSNSKKRKAPEDDDAADGDGEDAGDAEEEEHAAKKARTSASTADGAAAKSGGKKSLRVDNLVRPFRTEDVRDLLEKRGGKVASYWLDAFKTHALVTFEDEDSAVRAFEALQGLQWPEASPKKLAVKYVDDQDVTDAIEGKNNDSGDDDNNDDDESKANGRGDNNKNDGDNAEEDDKDDRPFLSTKAEPVIQWRPLTMEQSAKRVAAGKDARSLQKFEEENRIKNLRARLNGEASLSGRRRSGRRRGRRSGRR
eukprot:TRINITY_DN68070_c2_g1_i1.p2 TRINITY_DN68070_c2_g1~~TRINITY_DN68070_c2_g1_i1.p2  ORF type:complete len:333 (+),score=215.12 TRINITY_DN68070_c2_g1_i1:58-999(+)